MLAGGGYVASSWEIGLVTGMADAGLDVRDADLFVGTSAGARVALDLTGGEELEAIYQRRMTAAGPSGSPKPPPDWAAIKAGVADARQGGGSPAEILRRYGALALAISPGDGSDRRSGVAAQLPSRDWPERPLAIVAVNATTGERRIFDRGSGVDVADAVIATTASFGATPMLIDGQPYIDGGYYSSDNADLAVGYERVLILALRSPPEAMRLVPVEAGIEALRAAGALVDVVHPDAETLAALAPTGGQMNPASGKPAAIAGRLQGQRVAQRVAAFWRQA